MGEVSVMMSQVIVILSALSGLASIAFLMGFIWLGWLVWKSKHGKIGAVMCLSALSYGVLILVGSALLLVIGMGLLPEDLLGAIRWSTVVSLFCQLVGFTAFMVWARGYQ